MRCPICSQIMGASLHKKPGLSIVRCDVCGFYAADLDEWKYPYSANDYYTRQIDANEIQPRRPNIQHRVQEIARFKTTGKALDLSGGNRDCVATSWLCGAWS